MNPTPSQHPLKLKAVVAASILAAIVFCICLRRAGPRQDATGQEQIFARDGKTLLPIATAPPEGRAGQTITFGPDDLTTHQLYLRSSNDDRRWLYVDGNSLVQNGDGEIATVRASAELLLVPSGVTFFADGVPLLTETDEWKAYWVSLPSTGRPPKARVIPRVAVRDDFMREDLEVHPHARVTGGTVRLAQHGGGMPTTANEEANPNFQRAVNPFSIHASENGRLTYRVPAPGRWGDAHAEARFYFGVPKTGPVIDRESLPTDTDLLVTMGPEDGAQVAFGWSGSERCFVLGTRSGNGPWTVLAHWRDKRPPLTNWVKIGLECRQGHRVEGLLDDVPVLSADLPVRLHGPFHIQGGNALAEFDDVRAWSLPTPEVEPAPLFIRSRQFAGKRRKDNADPKGFDEWASSSHAFKKVRWKDAATGARCAAIVTGVGIIGDFIWESPGQASAATLSGVVYRFGVYPARPDRDVDIRKDPPGCTIRASRSDGGWTIRRREGTLAGPEADVTETTLVLGRRADKGNRLCLRMGKRWVPVSDPVSGPVHLAVIRALAPEAGRRFLLTPKPARHVVRCANLVQELFEEAPTAWNWVDGAFRMDCRWACQDQWNFMACGSTGLPYMASKRVFAGDQTHEAFMCLRATFPWDAGDATFTYDPGSDRANDFTRLKAAKAWYNRHDLNMSFCTDGRDPLSGYCVVFGGEDNTATRLLRRGVTVAESSRMAHLFPKDYSFMVVHYPWWRLTVTKTGARIRVSLDGRLLFDYTDPDPLDGGHLGFWSVRNGFAISRTSSMAEGIEWDPHAFYVTNVPDDGTATAWKPLVRGTVDLGTAGRAGLMQVTNTFGGGFFAVRHVPEQPVDLRETPRLKLPLQLATGARVSLHLEIGGKPFIVRLGDSPLAGIKAFLVPGSEKGECFQLRTLPESVVRVRHCLAEVPGGKGVVELDLLKAFQKLTRGRGKPILSSLTVGNSSNAGYLLAGHGGNAAGSTYSIGPPKFSR